MRRSPGNEPHSPRLQPSPASRDVLGVEFRKAMMPPKKLTVEQPNRPLRGAPPMTRSGNNMDHHRTANPLLRLHRPQDSTYRIGEGAVEKVFELGMPQDRKNLRRKV